METDVLHTVRKCHSLAVPDQLQCPANEVRKILLPQGFIHKTHTLRHDLIEPHAADGCLHDLALPFSSCDTLFHLCLEIHHSLLKRQQRLLLRAEYHTLPLLPIVYTGEEVTTKNHVLRGVDDRLASRRLEEVCCRRHELACLLLRTL